MGGGKGWGRRLWGRAQVAAAADEGEEEGEDSQGGINRGTWHRRGGAPCATLIVLDVQNNSYSNPEYHLRPLSRRCRRRLGRGKPNHRREPTHHSYSLRCRRCAQPGKARAAAAAAARPLVPFTQARGARGSASGARDNAGLRRSGAVARAQGGGKVWCCAGLERAGGRGWLAAAASAFGGGVARAPVDPASWWPGMQWTAVDPASVLELALVRSWREVAVVPADGKARSGPVQAGGWARGCDA